MATISKLRKEDLLGMCRINPYQEENKEALLHAMNHSIATILRIKKNDPKRFRRGVIIVDMTCRKCGLQFGLKLSLQAYLAILQINQIALSTNNIFAHNDLITQMLEKGKMSTVPVIDVFRYGISCPSCISKMKNGQMEKQ